jgi:pseudomonalisin
LRKFSLVRAFQLAASPVLPFRDKESLEAMTSRAVRLLTLGAALLALSISAPAAIAKQASRVWFPHNMLPLRHATNLGAPAPSRVMQLGLGLKDPHTAGELALLRAQETPGSSQFHRFVTPAQFNSRFGVSKTTFAGVLSWLHAGGADVLSTAGARNFVEISATVAQVDKLFQTHISSYVAKGVHFLANSSAPSVPARLDVLTIMGLNTLVHPTTPLAGAHRSARAPGSKGKLTGLLGGVLGIGGSTAGKVLAPAAKPAAGAPTIPASLTPQDMWSIYSMPSNNTGQGQSIAIIGSGDSSTTVKDLPLFEAAHGLPKVGITVTRIPADGDFSDNSGSVEWELDTQASTGMAPNVRNVHLYFGEHLTDPDAEGAFAKWVADPRGPKQANASFGECETTPANATLESTIPKQFNNNQDQNAVYGTGAPNALEPVADQTLRQANLEGRTLFAATGDTGSSCPVLVLGPVLGAGNGVLNQGIPIVNYPAASPYVVAVGGTVLYPDGSNPPQRGLEYPWPYTGGGQSFFIHEPTFQTGDANVNRPCLSDVAGNPNTSGTTCRGIPDVATESGDIATSSYQIYSDELGGASGEGGTSLSSPLMAGIWSRIQAAAPGGTGFADPDIYAVAQNPTAYARDFNDYMAGTNGAYQAAPGWDYVTGWGTPIVGALMKDVDHGSTAPIQGS